MNKWGLIGIFFLISLIAVFSAGFQAQPDNGFSPAVKDTGTKASVTIDKDYGKMPLAFIPNKGQMDKQVYFYLQGKDKSVYFTSTGLTYTLAGPTESQPGPRDNAKPGFSSRSSSRWVVKLDFVGARKDVIPGYLEKSGTVISYFKGKAAEWRTGLEAASKIIYRNLWPGIDLVYYGTISKIKYEFMVHPGADPAQIKLAYRGAASVKENSQGQLAVQTPAGSFLDDTPVAWQEIAGKRETVSLKYALENRNPSNPQNACTYGFSIGKYDKNETLILDPAVIVYCGYIGGSGDDRGYAIAVDGSGCIYVTGYTKSTETTFPVTVGPDLTHNVIQDAFVAKIKADGTALDYCGYIGGSSADVGYGIAVDATGNAYVTGNTASTEATFPVTVGPDLTYNGESYDAFVAKVNASGTALDYCGYIGGSVYEEAFAIAVDGSGCAYITGFTSSTQADFPVNVGPYLTYNDGYEAFVAKVKADGTSLDYCGYIGGSGTDQGYGIAVDGSGCAYITGATNSYQTTFPVTVGPDLLHNGGGMDAFVAKVRADGAGMVYCGYIGGSSYDIGFVIAVDGSGCAYITGHTTSVETSFPVTVGPDMTCNDGDWGDAFVAKVNADGSGLVYCGYIGGSVLDKGHGIAVDASGRAYITGYTQSTETTFPVTVGPDLTYNGDQDAFIARVKTDGSGLDYCGYIGGSGVDYGYGIAMDATGCSYITGETKSAETSFPVTVGPDLTHNGEGGTDAFVAKISATNSSYTVDFAAVNGGTLTGDTTQIVAYGGDCTAVEAVPNTGYQFVNWTGTNGFVTTTANPLTVTNVTADMTITANFAIDSPLPIQLGAWSTATPFNTPRHGHTSVAYNGYLYVMGGCDANDTIRYNDVQYAPIDADGSLGTWQVATPFNTGRHGHASVAYNGYLYVMGGTPSGGGVLNDVQFAPINADGSLGSWQSTTPFNTGRFVFSSVVYNGYLYVIQGFQYSAASPLTDVQVANINADGTLGPWQNTTTFAPGRWGHQSIAYNQYLYTMGGCNWNGSYYTLGDVQYSSINADGTLNAWQGTTALDPYRDAFGLVQYGGNLIMTGGINTSSGYCQYVQYAAIHADGTLGTWLRMTSFNKARGNHTSVVHNGYLYVIGGADNTTAFADVQYAKINEQSPLTHAVTFIESTGGTISGSHYQVITDGEDCAPVTAVPDAGCQFVNWTGTGGFATTTDNPLTVSNVTADMTITANFLLPDIAGRVTDTGSNGINNVAVFVYELGGTYVTEIYTDSNGDYTLTGIAPGSYKVEFNPWDAGNYIGEWYNDKADIDNADPVTVTEGQTTTLSDAVLEVGGIISGRVTDGVNGIFNVMVEVKDLDNNQIKNAWTDSSGYYTVDSLPTGNFKIYFDTYAVNSYFSEWYNDKSDFSSADQVSVTAGQTTNLVDAVLAQGGMISGTVKDSQGNGINGAAVRVYDPGNNYFTMYTTGSDGVYNISPIPTGDWKVYFDTLNAGNYLAEWYNDKSDFTGADQVSVTAGQTTTLSDAVMTEGGIISGRVTDSQGTGIESVSVYIYDLNNNFITNGYTDGSGNYSLQALTAGTYKVEFSPASGNYLGEWYNDKIDFGSADQVSVSLGQTTALADTVLEEGAIISGRVTDSQGTGILNVDIYVWALDGNILGSDGTDTDGYYTVEGVRPGDCRVSFETYGEINYIMEWYNDKSDMGSADTVSVSAGQTTTLSDAVLTEGAIISGRVTDSLANGIENVFIYVYDLSQNYLTNGYTDANGDYTIMAVLPGDCKVYFDTYSAGNYIEEWYNDKSDFNSADPVSLTAGQTNTLADVVLGEGGEISGTVKDSLGSGIGGVFVRVYDLSNNSLREGYTDGNGAYTISRIPPGDCKVYFDTAYAGNYAGEWYNDKSDFSSADPVSLTAGQTTALSDAVLGEGGIIGGTVTDSQGTGIDSVYVHIYDLNEIYSRSSLTDGNGAYTVVGLSTGDWKVYFDANSASGYLDQWYNDKGDFDSADQVSVTAGQTTSQVDAELVGAGNISGRVTDSTGTVGIADVEVDIFDLNNQQYTGVSTDSSGYYTIDELPVGTYKVQFVTRYTPGNYIGEWYNDKISFDSADTITVTLGQTTTLNDALLDNGGAISGRCTDVTGTIGVSAGVGVFDLNNNGLPAVGTSEDGYYQMNGVPAGTYKVYFNTDGRPNNYVSGWHLDKDTFDNADTVQVFVGQTTADIDGRLQEGGYISGRVTDSVNNGIANVDIYVYDMSENNIASASTDGNGDYTVSRVPAGDYKVQFQTGNAGNYLGEWYSDQGSFNDANTVTVTAGSTTTGIDAQLAAGGIITGKVMDSSLMGIENVWVYLYDLNYNGIGNYQTDSYGDYTIRGLASGGYKIYFEAYDSANSYINEWYNNAGEFDNANEVAVTAGQTTYNINAVLEDGGAVSGRVTDSTGTTGIANVEVQICDLTGYWKPGTNTDSDGYYTLTGIPGGDYKIEFRTHWVPGNYVSEWYNDKDSFDSADVVTVTVGQTATGINAQLADGGGVSGRVTDSSGTNGIGNVYVNICDLNQNWLHGVNTDNDGYYTIYGVPDGSYKIQFDPHSAGNYSLEWWNNKRSFDNADTVIVTTGNTVTDINAQLEESGGITGTVSDDSSAAAVEDVRVYVYDLSNNDMGSCWTDANGNYTVNNLYPGNYKIYFNTSNVPVYIEEWYNDKDSFENADEVTVNEGAATTVDAGLSAIQDDSYEPNDNSGTAAEMTPGTYNNLVYLSPDGAGVEQDWYKVYVGPENVSKDLKVNIKVTSPYPPNPPDWWDSDLDFKICDESGRLLAHAYSSSDDETLYIVNLSAGWYYICVNYCSLWYNPDFTGVHADYAMTVEISDSFPIGYISGRVTNEQDQGIGDVLVEMNHNPFSTETCYPAVTTDDDGYYAIGFTPGDYKLHFNDLVLVDTYPPPNYVPEYYNDTTSFSEAEGFTLHVGTSITGIDAELMAGATIEGTLTHANGNPIVEDQRAYAMVYVDSGEYWVSYSYNDASGNYSVKYLAPGTYKVRFRGWDENWNRYAREWYDDQPSLGTGHDVVISTVGEVLTGINAQFSNQGIIQGRVTNAGGGGIADVMVCVYHPSDPDNIMVTGYTDGNGDFYIREVFPGDVKIFFDADEQNTAYVSEWYNDQGDFNGADLVSVTAGQTVSGIDAQLADKGSISGRVTDSSGTTGIENVDVNVQNLNGDWINGTNTDANGDYTIDGIPAGDYKVEFNPENASGNYIREWYNDKNSFESADTVTVIDGQTTSSIDAQLADGAAISGRVTDSSGTLGIENVDVQILDPASNWYPGTSTDSDGYYTIQGLSAGDYKIQFRTDNVPGNYIGEWYNDKFSFESADTLSLTAGQTVTGIDAQLVEGGAISGRVTDATGTVGIANVDVQICDLARYWLPQGTSTDSEGYYTLPGIPAGDYKIEFRTNWTPGNYVGEWYNDKFSFESADTVSVTVGQTTAGVDAQLANGGAISGRVTNSSGGGIANVNVQICDLNQYWYNGVSTDNDGYYTIYGLPAGGYKIEFRTHNAQGNYTGEWYNDKDSFDNADVVSVTVGQTTTGIDAQLAEGGAVSGRVTDSSGTVGVYNVDVQVYDLNNYWIDSTSTDNDGYYTMQGLPSGDYKIEFTTNWTPGDYVGEWYNDKDSFDNADSISVTVGQTTTGIDARLADGGSISGRVTDSTGTVGINNVNVNIRDMNNNWYHGVNTDNEGYYTVYGLPAGDYSIEFNPNNASGNYVREWYNDQDSFENADVVSVTVGQTTTGIDAQLADGGSISGRVTDSSSNGIANVDVQLYDLNNIHIHSTSTDSNGDYTFNCLPPGDFKIYFETNNAGNYLTEWYNDKGAFDEADVVVVTAGQTTGNIDAQLTDGGTISGRVTNESAEGIEAVHIRVLYPDGSWADGTNTDADGNYTVNRLAAGSYIVDFYTGFIGESYVREWYNDKGSFNSADPVDVTAGATTTIDAVLERGGIVSGRVTNDSAVGIQNVRVDVKDMNNIRKAYAYTDENGDYTVKGFPGGIYKVNFYAYTSSENYIPEWYNDKDSFYTGDTVSVTAGQTVTGIDAVLAPGCSISGTVTDASANPIQFVEVYACDIAGNFIYGGDTDGSGNYEVNGLIPGSYKVFFYPYYLNHYGVEWYGLPRDYNYKYEWYNDKENFAEADMVAVTPGSPATGIDAVMAEDGGIITGQITDSLGNGIQDCIVFAFYAKDNFLDYENSNYSDSDGYYEVKGLPAGNYIVTFRPLGGTSYRSIIYNNTLDMDNATEVPVLAGQTTSGINAVLPKGGVITGRVTDGNGNGLNEVTVRLIDAATNKYSGFIGNGTMTDADGYYTINAQAGQWKLLFMGWSISGGVEYVSEFYNDQSGADSADILTVNVNETLSDIDAVLSPGGGKISGYVKNAAENGLYGVIVEVYDGQYDYWIGNGQTDTNGYFEIPGLMPGNYKIITRTNDIYPVEWYSDKTSYETADLVTVTEGGNTEVTIILGGSDPGATAVTGRVTDYSGSGIENVNVNIYDLDNNFIDSASTDTNGDYAVEGIPSGSYKVYVDTETAGNWLAEWYQNKGTFDEADTITVTTGQSLENIDAQLAEGAIISGRAMNEAEVGVEGVRIRVRDLDSNLIATANTDANGDYTIERLPANSYKVYFDVKNANGYYVGQWYNNRDSFDAAHIVVVMAGVTTEVDAILGDGIGISGTVTDNSANPLAGIEVDVYDTGGLYVNYGYTDSSGNYEVKGLAPGSYKVNFVPVDLNYHGVDWFGLPANTNYKLQWYNNKEYFTDADVVSAAPGSAATGIDAVMTDGEGGIISGQITDSQANGIAGCFVYAFQSFDAQEWYYSDYMETGADGNYQVKGLPTGNYIVFFIQPGGTYYRRQFYNNTMDRYLATPVSVTAGQTTPGINAVLQKGGIVTGRVTDSSGNGLENVYIRLMEAATNKYLGWVGNTGQTDADGYFTIEGLAGQWKVMFQTFAMNEQGYVSEFYNNRAAVENGDIITVAVEEEVSNINAVLSPGGGKISGFVKDPGNAGLYNAYIEVYDTQYQTFVGHTNTGLNGYFEVPGLIPGNYKLYADYYRIYPFEWYSDQTAFAGADELTVTNGGNTQVLVMLGADDPDFPSITVTSPNGGESITGGTTHDITWTGQENIEAVLIEYSIDNGDSWITIVPFAENTGSYQWTVPETPADNCLVRIGAGDSDAGPVDVSDAVFSIVSTGPSSINLKSPNRWVTITAGTTEEITWHWTGSGDVDNIMLEYSIDSGQTWLMIVPGTANTGSYFWYVPNTPSEHCLIRIQVGEGDEALSNISTVEFSIVTPAAPVLNVTSPNGGETWKVGYFYNITWDTIGTIDDVKLEYSINGGGSWTEIIATTPNTGSYDWTVPDSPAESCLVRVSDVLGGSTDTGNESFAIVPAPTATLDVTSPNGGESLTTGTTHDITWTGSGLENVENVMIEYSTDNGASWITVVPAAAHSGSGGSYNWTVPDTPSETCLVRITDNSSDEGPSDVSDAVFTIEPAPFITVTSPDGGEQWQTGSTYAINWTYSGITGNVVIDLYRGTSFDCNITTTAVDTGSFDWNIPISFTNADDYKVLIYQDTIEDYSDNSFSINDNEPNHPDFNNDGHVDILWRNYATGGNEVWLMNQAVHSGTNSLQAEPGLDWRIVGTGDFNRDGKIDLLWRNYTNGQNLVWYMNGTALTGTASLPVQPDVTWQVAGVGDFNSDGSVDILWRNVSGGRNQLWYMNGVTVSGYMGLPELKDTAWRIAGLGDFNDDDKVDILWRNYVTGNNQVWYMDGVTRTGIIDLMAEADLAWQIAGTGDFNQDGKIDILWRRYSDGMNMIWYMDGIVRLGFEYIEARADLTWRIAGNGDYKE